MAADFTLLTAKQIWGDDALDVIKKYGIGCSPTDLAVLLGGSLGMGTTVTPDLDITGSVWTRSQEFITGYAVCTNPLNHQSSTSTSQQYLSVRPVLSPSEAQKLEPTQRMKGVNGLDIVTWGEYPQTVVSRAVADALENAFKEETLLTTGKKYTFDEAGTKRGFKKPDVPEYELDGKKYIRVTGRRHNPDSRISNGKERVQIGQPYWVAVEPIEWLVDPSGFWVSKRALFSGIRFDTGAYYDGGFSDTIMKKYLDACFAKDVEPSELMSKRLDHIQGVGGILRTLMEASGKSKAVEEYLRQRRGKRIKAELLEELEKLKDIEAIKKNIEPARTPERTDELARITQVRRGRDAIIKAVNKIHKTGDNALLQELADMEIVRIYDARDRGMRDRVNRRRTMRRLKREGKE